MALVASWCRGVKGSIWQDLASFSGLSFNCVDLQEWFSKCGG